MDLNNRAPENKATDEPSEKDQNPAVEQNQNSSANLSAEVWQTRAISSEMAKTLPDKARSFVDAINKRNTEFKLSADLILAAIETESAFNPPVKSQIPAYGLMQIVPKSAGIDATQKIFGKRKLL